MKKNILIGILTSAIFLISNNALAYPYDNRIYLGGEVSWNIPKYKPVATNLGNTEAPKNRLGGDFFAGLQLHDYFAVEVGYGYINKNNNKNSNNNEVSVKVKNFYVDLVGIYPWSHEIDLIARIGLGKLDPEVVIANESITKNDEVNSGTENFRFGAGVQYNFDEKLGGRLTADYQIGNNDFIERNVQLGIGLVWYIN